MDNSTGRRTREWLLSAFIAAVPGVIALGTTGSVLLGVTVFVVLLGFLRPKRVLPARSEADRSLAGTAEPANAPSTPPPERLQRHVPWHRRWRLRRADRAQARRRRMVNNGFRATVEPRVCIHCRYELSGLPDHHTCPECGKPYSFVDIDAYFDNPDAYRAAKPEEFT